MKNRQMQALLAGPDGLGTRLRAARGRLSMQQLADALNEAAAGPEWQTAKIGKWSSSKVSKLETGQQLPSADEVELWAAVTGVDNKAGQRWQNLRNDAEGKRSVYRRRTAVRDSAGSPAGQLEAVAALTRVVQPVVIPELLQVEEYTRALWTPVHTENEVDAIVAALRERQDALRAPNKKFQFLIGEAALRTIRGGRDTMATQLDRLISAATLPAVTIGIIPLSTLLRGPAIDAGFALYDLDEAVVGDGVEDRRYTGAPAALLRERLDGAWEDAVTDRAARKLLLNAIDALGLD